MNVPTLYITTFILFVFAILLKVTSFQPKVIYVSYSSTLHSTVLPSSLSTINYNNVISTITYRQVLSSLMSTDDSPFESVDLSWPFQFFGEEYFTIYVSPNGALHVSPQQPCPTSASFGDASPCNFNTSYYGLIGGFLADLNPSQVINHNGNITLLKGDDFIMIEYINIPFYGYTTNQTFSITLWKDGHVDLSYYTLHLSASDNKSPSFLSGLRVPQTTNLKANISISQEYIGYTNWITNINGIYPYRSNVVGGKMFTACPISMTWCALPSSIVLDTSLLSISTSMIVKLTPLSISCDNSIQLAAYINPSAVLSDNSIQLSICNFQGINGNKSISCQFNQLINTAGNYSIYLAWRVIGSHSAFSPLPDFNPIPLIVLPSGSITPSTTCALNDVIGGGCSSSSSSCDICNGDLTCLGLQCMSATNPDLYNYPSCNGTCVNSSSPANYYKDLDNVCCQLDDIDCLGYCYGNALPSYTTSGTKICCVKTVDCLGICDGTAKRDACGICQGTDLLGKSCSTYIDIAVLNSSSPDSIYPVIDMASNSFWDVVMINVTNQNSSYILVDFLVVGRQTAGPDISLPRGTYTIPGFTSMLFPVNVSMTSVYTGHKGIWDVKDVSLLIRRPDKTDLQFNYALSVFPSSINCGEITSRPTCMRMPACIYCISYPGLRILKEVDEIEIDNSILLSNTETSNVDELRALAIQKWVSISLGKTDQENKRVINVEGYESASPTTRELYTNIMADQAGVKSYSITNGVCVDGWMPSSCDYPINSGSLNQRYSLTITFATLLLSCFAILSL